MLVQFTVPGLVLLHNGFPDTVGYSVGAVHCPWAALPTPDWRQEEAWPCIILACTSAGIQLAQLLAPLCLHLIEPNANVNSAAPRGQVGGLCIQCIEKVPPGSPPLSVVSGVRQRFCSHLTHE